MPDPVKNYGKLTRFEVRASRARRMPSPTAADRDRNANLLREALDRFRFGLGGLSPQGCCRRLLAEAWSPLPTPHGP